MLFEELCGLLVVHIDPPQTLAVFKDRLADLCDSGRDLHLLKGVATAEGTVSNAP